MVRFYTIFLIQIHLIYTGNCLRNIQNPVSIPEANAGGLHVSSVDKDNFEITWTEEDFPNSFGLFNVNIEDVCDVQYDCTDYEPICTFSNVAFLDDCYLSDNATARLIACANIKVTVSRGDLHIPVSFNLAPDIGDNAITPDLTLDGTIATVTWNDPTSSDNTSTQCATRARVELPDGSDPLNGKAMNVSQGEPNTYSWTVEDCYHGTLTAMVIYLTQTHNYDTVKNYHATTTDDMDLKGVGVIEVNATGTETCGIDVSWDVGCSEVHHYKVTGSEADPPDVTDGTNNVTIPNQSVGTYTIKVQAYWNNTDTFGDKIKSDATVITVAPDPPAVDPLVSDPNDPTKLTVSWSKPTSPTCAGDISGYTITYPDGGDPVPVDGGESVSYPLSGLKACTVYTVSVAAKWSEGTETGAPGSNTGETGSRAPGKPVPTVGSFGHTDISLNWDKPNTTNSCPLTGYTITWTPKDNTTGTDDVKKDVQTYTIGDLICNTEYTIKVTAKTDGKTSTSKDIIKTTTDKTPNITNVSMPAGKDKTKLDVSWTGPTDYDCTGGLGKYKVTWTADEGDASTDDTADVDNSTYTIKDLRHCTPYTVSVQARSKTGTLGSQGTEIATTTADPPGKPTIAEPAVNEESVELSWEPTPADSCGLTGYTVNWKPGDDGDGAGEYDAGSNESYTIKDLICNRDYTIDVTFRADDDQSTPSDTKNITTKDRAPEVTNVTEVLPDKEKPTQLTAAWNEPGYACTGSDLGDYKVSWTVNGEVIDTKDAPTTSTTIDGLVPCTPYTISVEARSNNGKLGPLGTSMANETSVEVPGISSGISKESSYTPYSLDVNWNEPPTSPPDGNPCTITEYTVKWSSISDGEGQMDNVTSIPYTIPDLNACTDYDITVIAYTVKGPGEPSITKTLTTDKAVPGISTDLNQTSVTSNSVEVNWSPPVDSRNPCAITKYTVEWVSSSGETEEDDTVTKPPYNITGLIACTDYTITVIAHTEKGPGEHGVTVPATTDKDVPGISTEISRKSFNSYALEVEWSPPPTSPPDGNPCTIANYTVQWSDSSDGKSYGYNETTVIKSPYNITGLNACTDYYITVIAYTDKGAGDPSEEYKNSTGVDAPELTDDKVNIASTSRAAQVTWEKPDTSCNLTYNVEHSGNTLWTNNKTSDPGKTQTIDDPIHSATLDELLPYSKYDVCVTVNNNINGEKTCKTFTTEEAVPSAPRNVSVDGFDDVSLTLTWDYPEAENGILLNYVVSWGMEGESSNNYTVDADDITSHTIYELEEGNYFFSVRAVNTKGSSGQSDSIEQEMNGHTACGGGCIAGIVIGILLVALAIPAFIFRDRIMHTIKPGPPPVEESPYELRGAAILKSDFRRHVEELGLDRAERAYQMLNDESQQKTKFAAAKPFNKGKNRFANIHPFDETRVKLQLMRNGPKGSDYINANHITFPDTFTLEFIATQGPLDSTINDFWRMIWEHKVYDTVMLCNLFEKGKSKCAQYWTENGERSMEFGDFKISCQAEEEDMSKTFITRYIDVVKDGQHRMVKQHHFLAWPDFGVPENEEGLLRFLASVKRNVNEHGTNVLTHCSAGVGRTGTFIALWVLTSLLEQNKSAKSIDVHQISLMMREGRSDMIQTKDQYLYLHKCLLKYMENTGNSFPISNKDEEEPIYGNVNTGYQQ